MMTEILNIRL